jgi:anaerobic dimethyl sulfoxide reductase subunit C (anchor subunit)
MLREFALIAFTILGQMAVGAFLVMCIIKFFTVRKAGQEAADQMADRALVAIIVALGLGLLASLFHLGSPLSAPRAVTNIATSALSREILAGVVFAVLGFLYTILQLFKLGPSILRDVLAWLTALAGIVLVYFMSMVYMLPTRPAWNTIATPISFFTTTLLLGCLAMGVAYVVNYSYLKSKNPGCADEQCTLLRSALQWIAIASMILLGIEFVLIPSTLLGLAVGSPQALASAKLIAGVYGSTFFFRLLLAFVGAGVFGLFLYKTAQVAGKEKMLGYIVVSAFVLVFVAEVLGRYLFYSAQVAITM